LYKIVKQKGKPVRKRKGVTNRKEGAKADTGGKKGSKWRRLQKGNHSRPEKKKGKKEEESRCS